MQNANHPERSLSRASSNLTESSISNSGRESIASFHPHSTHTSITTSSTTSIENPITSLQEYCKLHMIPFDIKSEMCQSLSKAPDQRQLYDEDFFRESSSE